MPIVATAGHVDHGKSTLVLALTGRDPDRWAEEKRRGLTIDLGFAWVELDGMSVGLVDVPGHERFIKNMLAGVGAVDVALFVVAGDEGWMPQTEEHLGVIDTLEIEHGVIALTKVDRVDDELQELAMAEIEERVEGTRLERWPVVPVAATTGAGLDDLRTALSTALRNAGPVEDLAKPRMWIDRSFTIGGAGLVVTGTLVDGSLKIDDKVTLWPGEHEARVRSIQSHEQTLDVAVPGSRVAVNLSGVDREDIERGAMLGVSDAFAPTNRFLATITPVRGLEDPISQRGAFHLHAGTGSWSMGLQFLEPSSTDASAAAIVRVDGTVPLRMGDRFVVREVGRQRVIAGGRVLDPRPSTSRNARTAASELAAAVPQGSHTRPDRNHMADVLLAVRGSATADALTRDTGGGIVSTGIDLGTLWMTAPKVEAYVAQIGGLVAAFHEENPLRPGIPKATVASTVGLDSRVIDRLLADNGAALADDGATVRRADFAVVRTPEQTKAWEAARNTLRDAGMAVPRSSSLGLADEFFHVLVREGELVVLGEDVAYLPEQIETILRTLPKLGDGFSVAEFRDALNITRRHAVPTLEWLDANGWTGRRGDTRIVRRQLP